MRSPLRRLRRALAGRRPPPSAPLHRQREACGRALTLVGAFYACHLFAAFLALARWRSLAEAAALDPLWPVAWAPGVGIELATHGVMAALLLGAVWAAFAPGLAVARLAACVGFFLYVALSNSFGKINHSSHAWLLCSFLLVFLPDGDRDAVLRSRLLRQRYLNAFWSAQALLLLTYSLAGSWKLIGTATQLWRGEMHSLAPPALAYHIADRLLRTGSDSLLGGLFVEHPLLGWPALLTTLYLQTMAFVAAFRFPLHRLWGLGLIGFHVMVFLTMSIAFQLPVLALGIFLLCSPFAPARLDAQAALRALPLFGDVLSRLPRAGGAAGPGYGASAGRRPATSRSPRATTRLTSRPAAGPSIPSTSRER